MTTKPRAPRKTATKETSKTKGTKEAGASKAASRQPATTKKAALVKRPEPITLITGGTGFLGSHLVRQLVESGQKNLRVLATSNPAWLSELGVEVVSGSVMNRADVARSLAGVTDVYHLAGRVSRESGDTHTMYSLHVEGTRLLCDVAREAGVKTIVMASSSGTIAVTADGDATPDEDWSPPLDIISRWPYYASKYYQERVALENFSGEGRRLVILNPSLLLGPGDERLSSTKVVLDFLARKIISTPHGGLNFVDVRDAAAAFRAAMERGAHGERYLLGAANWSFEKFFGRLERLTKVSAPRMAIPSKLAVSGAHMFHSLFRHWKWTPPVEPQEIEMAEHFWYFDWSKAERELGFVARDTAETLHDTVEYVRKRFLGSEVFD